MAPLLEWLAVLAAIVAWLPAFERVATFGDGRDDRYADAGVRVDGLPEPVLPAICRGVATFAAPEVRASLCGSTAAAPAPASWQALSGSLAHAVSRAARAFNAPVVDARLRLDAWRLQQREGLGDLRDVAGAMSAIESDLRPYLQRFRLDAAGDAAPQPLGCALRWAQAAIGAPGDDAARAHAVLLMAAALDGRGATGGLAAQAALPPTPRATPPCEAGAAATLSAAAALMDDARQSRSHARKNEAMRALLATAGWQWAGRCCSASSSSCGAGMRAARCLARAWRWPHGPWPLGWRARHGRSPKRGLSSRRGWSRRWAVRRRRSCGCSLPRPRCCSPSPWRAATPKRRAGNRGSR